MMLTRLERNEVFRAIEQGNLDPAECALRQNETEAAITHTSSGSTFKFNRRSLVDAYGVESNVTDGHYLKFQTARLIDSVTPWIMSWADEVRRTADAPDLWAGLQRSRELIVSIEPADSANTPFTQDEQRQIAAHLQQIKENVKEQFELTSEQVAHIDERLDEAAEAAERMGRKDWLLLFGGTILNLIVTDTVTPSVAGHIFWVVISGIIHLFGGGPPHILT